MSLSELSEKLKTMVPVRAARELTCDGCGKTGPDVEVFEDPAGRSSNTGYLGEKFLCQDCQS